MGRAFTMKEGLSRRGIPKFKVDHLKVHVGTTSALLNVANHRVSVGLLRGVRLIIVHLTGFLLTVVMGFGILSML